MPSQSEFRQQALIRRRHLNAAQKNSANTSIVAILRQSRDYVTARNIAMYMPLADEVDPTLSIELDSHHKRFCLPIVRDDNTLFFVTYQPGDKLIRGRFGTREPIHKPHREVDLKNLDLIVMPCVAFDENGVRIGMGGGSYDKTLAKKAAPDSVNIALAFETQRVKPIEKQKWDVVPHAIITEKAIY